MSFSLVSKIIQGDTRVWTRDISDCSRMFYCWAISPLHTDSITSLQTRAGCLSTVTMFFNVFCSESSVLSRSMSFFSSLSKIIQGDTLCSNQGSLGLQPNALPRAISPLHTDSKISLQTRSGCLSTVTMFLVPSKVYSRDRCHFSLVSKIYKGTPGSKQGPLGLQPNALPLSFIPAAYRFNNITANTCRLFEHCYNGFCSESSVLSRSMSFFSILSKIIQGDTRVRNRDVLGCSRALSQQHTDSITSLQTRAGCLSCYNVFCSESRVLSRWMSFFSSLSKRGHPGSNQRPLGLQSNALPLSYIPAACIFNNITANTCRLFEHCYNGFCSEASVLSRSISFFSSLPKIIQGDTRVRTRDLSDCSRMLYHWAISPLHTDSIISLQTRSGCLSTVTIIFVPSKMYSRDRCHFSLVFQKFYKGTPGFEPGTSRTAAECSTAELYTRCIQIQ